MELDANANADAEECSLCATTPGEIARRPEPPANQTFSILSCNHRVHTHCLVHALCTLRQQATCGECAVTVVRAEDINFYRHLYDDDYELRRRAMVEELWRDNEEFRREILLYKKCMAKANTSGVKYRKDLRVVKNRFKQNILTSIELINDQKRIAKEEYKRIESAKVYKKNAQHAQRMLRGLRTRWDVDQWSLRNLNNIDGAPKISANRYYRWRETPTYLFRVRV